MASEPDTLKKRARRVYEMARLRSALAWSVPALAIATIVAVLVGHASIPLAVGLALYIASVGLLWWGREPGRGVLPGFVYGLLPLGGALLGRLHSHACMGAACYQVCTLTCLAGGLVAGLLIARLAIRSRNRIALFLSAASVALLTGAIGGACMGVFPVVGMAVALAVGFLPVALRARPRLQ